MHHSSRFNVKLYGLGLFSGRSHQDWGREHRQHKQKRTVQKSGANSCSHFFLFCCQWWFKRRFKLPSGPSPACDDTTRHQATSWNRTSWKTLSSNRFFQIILDNNPIICSSLIIISTKLTIPRLDTICFHCLTAVTLVPRITLLTIYFPIYLFFSVIVIFMLLVLLVFIKALLETLTMVWGSVEWLLHLRRTATWRRLFTTLLA